MAGFLSVRPQDWATPQAPAAGVVATILAFTPFGGVYKTEDGGATWTNLLAPASPAPPNDASHIDLLQAVPNQDGNHIILAINGHTGGAPTRIDADFSQDGGATWTNATDITTIGPTDELTPVGLVIIDEDTAIATDGLTVVRTADAGGSWSDVTSSWDDHSPGGLDGIASYSVATATKVWGFVVSDSGNGMARWSQDGSGREDFPDTVDMAGVFALSDTDALVFDTHAPDVEGHLWKIEGTTATDITPEGGTDGVYGAASPDGSLIVANTLNAGSAAGKIWRSTDGGDTWSTVLEDAALVNAGPPSTVQFLPWDTTRWFVAGYPKFFFSSDSGATWVSVAVSTEFDPSFPTMAHYVGPS
jgi:hypothetical protein